jgi:hypothetical protein
VFGARAAVAALALVGLLLAAGQAHAGESRVPSRFFGVMWDKTIQDAPDRVQAAQWRTMRRAGVGSTRVIFGWHLAQLKRSHKPNFVRTDRMVRNAARNRIDLLPVVMYAPRWARVDPNVLGSAPKYPRRYGHYVSELVRRYGPRGYFWRRNPKIPRRPIRNWQIWNEPHLEYQFSPHRGWQKRYAELLRIGYRAVKKRDRKATVVLGGFVNDAWRTVASLHRRARVRGYYDAAALHMYSADPADQVEILRRFRVALNANGSRRKPIYITEIGASASRGVVESPGHEHFQVTDEELADLIPASYRALARVRRRYRLERVVWYTWASPYRGSAGVFDYSGLNAYDGAGVEARPALGAYRRTTAAYRGR